MPRHSDAREARRFGSNALARRTSLPWVLIWSLATTVSVTMMSCSDDGDPNNPPDSSDAGTDTVDASTAADAGLVSDAEETINDAGEIGADGGDSIDASDEQPDGGLPTDSGSCVPSLEVTEALASTSSVPPERLWLTGLFDDIPGGTVSPLVENFEPEFPLWSDGAEKTRWIFLPECKKIDTTDMDHWSMPVGTKLWKEFRVDGQRIETRMISRYGEGPDDFFFAAYLWNESETDADLVPAGMRNARGTTHDVPPVAHCHTCHDHLSERILGFSAIQLNHEGHGLTLASLAEEARLTDPPTEPFVVPGDSTATQALGYLHANCGNCHHEDEGAIAFIRPFALRLSWYDKTLAQTAAVRTCVRVPVEKFSRPDVTRRIEPGDPEASAVVARMEDRGSLDQMPPIGTKQVDHHALDAIRAWIFNGTGP